MRSMNPATALRDRVRWMALMDHTSGQRQWTDISHYRVYVGGKRGWSEEKIDAMLGILLQRQKTYADANRREVVRLCSAIAQPAAGDARRYHGRARGRGRGSKHSAPATISLDPFNAGRWWIGQRKVEYGNTLLGTSPYADRDNFIAIVTVNLNDIDFLAKNLRLEW